jgi:tRNA(fMet)-specific endonuclease VapC
MVVLDTDHMSILEREQTPATLRLRERMRQEGVGNCATTIISYEEQARGWLSYLASGKSLNDQIKAYRRLKQQLNNYCSIPVLDFDEHAAVVYQGLKKSKIRLGAMDLKIGSIAIATGATLLTGNLSDFQKVPGIRLDNWITD